MDVDKLPGGGDNSAQSTECLPSGMLPRGIQNSDTVVMKSEMYWQLMQSIAVVCRDAKCDNMDQVRMRIQELAEDNDLFRDKAEESQRSAEEGRSKRQVDHNAVGDKGNDSRECLPPGMFPQGIQNEGGGHAVQSHSPSTNHDRYTVPPRERSPHFERLKLEKFSGRKANGDMDIAAWDNLKRRFLMRYEGMNDRHAVLTLSEFLQGEAREAFLRMPEECQCTLNGCFGWLDAQLGDRSPCVEREYWTRFKGLKKNDRNVYEFFDELESLSDKIFREANERDRVRVNKVMDEYERTSEAMELMRVMDSPMSIYDKYKKLKAEILRSEHLNKVYHESSAYQSPQRWTVERECYKCGAIGHKSYECFDRQRREREREQVECFRCGELGHYERECQEYAPWHNPAQEEEQWNERGNEGYKHGGYEHGQNQWSQYLTHVPKEHFPQGSDQDQSPRYRRMGAYSVREGKCNQPDDPYFGGNRLIVHGTIGGVGEEILIDTGADISIVSEQIMERIPRNLLVIENSSKMLYDASGGQMPVTGRCKLEVTVGKSGPTVVGFYIVKGRLNKSILGMNALPKLGLTGGKGALSTPGPLLRSGIQSEERVKRKELYEEKQRGNPGKTARVGQFEKEVGMPRGYMRTASCSVSNEKWKMRKEKDSKDVSGRLTDNVKSRKGILVKGRKGTRTPHCDKWKESLRRKGEKTAQPLSHSPCIRDLGDPWVVF